MTMVAATPESGRRATRAGAVFCLAEALEPLVVQARGSGMDVELDIEAGLRARARMTTVAEIVHRLLDNARRHAPAAPVRVSAAAVEHAVEVRVVDDGPGLSVGQRALALEAGWRGAGSRGAGLGLFIAAQLAREQGGTLHLVEPPARGVCVVVRLPRDLDG